MRPGTRVALTIDTEHPDAPPAPDGGIPRILAALDDADVTATFFVQGRWATAYPGDARRIAQGGHVVGHHSYSHANLARLTAEGIEADLLQGAEAIEATTGIAPRPWFRCPYGGTSHSERLFGVLDRHDYRDVHWHVSVEDWEPACTRDVLLERAFRRTAEPAAEVVVLLHSWPPSVAAALPELLDRWQDDGATFVTIDALTTLPT